jgi:OHCU decarboxylase
VTVAELDQLPESQAREALTACCGAEVWVRGMMAARPFGNREALLAAADRVWGALPAAQVAQAIAHHPRLGESAARAALSALEQRWSAGEQSGAPRERRRVRAALATGNDAYERRFGHTFILCAAGLDAAQMLACARAKAHERPRRRTRHHRRANCTASSGSGSRSSSRTPEGGCMLTITTHVLDLSSGTPAAGVAVTLELESDGRWESHGRAVTDADGRVRDAFGGLTGSGRFRLTFATGAWFAAKGVCELPSRGGGGVRGARAEAPSRAAVAVPVRLLDLPGQLNRTRATGHTLPRAFRIATNDRRVSRPP